MYVGAFRGGVLILCMLWLIHHVWVIGHTEQYASEYGLCSRFIKNCEEALSLFRSTSRFFRCFKISSK